MEPIRRGFHWYALYTRVNQEKKVFRQLVGLGIECYLPLRKCLRQYSDRKVWVEEPFFRSYLFVHVSPFEFLKARCMPGVIQYVTFDGKAYPIADGQMENIKTMINQHEREITISRENIGKGQWARVIFGPFKGMMGEVVKICNSYRILIRINSIGCNLYANISKDEIIVMHEVLNPAF